jgi:hypothetical protein
MTDIPSYDSMPNRTRVIEPVSLLRGVVGLPVRAVVGLLGGPQK